MAPLRPIVALKTTRAGDRIGRAPWVDRAAGMALLALVFYLLWVA